MADLIERYELALFAYFDMAEERYRTGQDTGAAVRWELHHAAGALRAVEIPEHELSRMQAEAMVKLAVLRRVLCSTVVLAS